MSIENIDLLDLQSSIAEKVDSVLETYEKCSKNSVSKKEVYQTIVLPEIKRVYNIKEICDTNGKYNLIFMGGAGVGKSTAISNLFGLIDKDELKKGGNLSELPILKTGSGGTTSFPFNIVFREKDSDLELKVEHLNKEEIENKVKDFCNSLAPIIDIKDENNNKQVTEEALTHEERELIEHLTNFESYKEEESEEDFKIRLKNYIKNHEGDFVTTNSSEILSHLKKILSRIIQEKSREDIIFKYEKDSSSSKEQWLKKLINNLNSGKQEGVGYPKIVSILIPRPNNIPSFINEVQDTMGISCQYIRPDLLEHIREIKEGEGEIVKKGNINIICDSIKNYGNALSEGAFGGIFEQLRDVERFNFLICLNKSGQLGEVKGTEDIEDIEEKEKLGKEKKIERAYKSLKEKGIRLKGSNMHFYNAYEGIEIRSKNKEIIEFLEEEYKKQKEDFFEFIENNLKSTHKLYLEELEEIKNKLEKASKEKLDAEDIKAIKSILEIVENKYEELKEKLENVEPLDDFFFGQIKSLHWKRLKASINRYGKYENYNFFYQISEEGKKRFKNELKEVKGSIIQFIESSFSNKNIQHLLKDMILKELENLWDVFITENGESYRKQLESSLNGDDWEVLQRLHGTGYVRNVANKFLELTNNKNLNIKIKECSVLEKFFTSFIEHLGNIAESRENN